MRWIPNVGSIPSILILIGLLARPFGAFGQANDSLRVESISLLGAKKTLAWVITRELTFKKGDLIHPDQLEAELERSRTNVYNLGLFNDVSTQTRVDQGALYIAVTVVERWYLFPTFNVRLEERNTNDAYKALFSGDFTRAIVGAGVNWRNVSGRNETLDLYGQIGYTQKLSINFKRPAISRKFNVDMNVAFSYLREREIIIGTDSGIVRRGRVDLEPIQQSYTFFLGLQKRFSIYQHLFMELSYKNFVFSDSLNAFKISGEPLKFGTRTDNREFLPSLVIGYSEDRRDLKSYPMKGYKYQLLMRLTGPKPLGSAQFIKVGATWAHHIPMSERWNFSYGTHHVYTFGDSIPFMAKTFVGISRSDFPNISTELRGYEPFAISGTYVTLNKFELKFAIFPRRIIHLDFLPVPQFRDTPLGIYLSAYADTGYVLDRSFNNQDPFLKNRLLTGYGLGLNIIAFYDMLARIELSRNHLGMTGIYFNGVVPIK